MDIFDVIRAWQEKQKEQSEVDVTTVTLCYSGFVTPKNQDNLLKNKGFSEFVTNVTAVTKKNNETENECKNETDVATLDANLGQAKERYYDHHFACLTCVAAGRGHGPRCQEGANLWKAYCQAVEKAQPFRNRFQ